MADTHHNQKKNKKKKKSALNENQPNSNETEVLPKENVAVKTCASLASVLPQKVGLTTKLNDVEVTMTKNENDVTNGTSKKKKKKKKKQSSVENAVESSTNEDDNQNLLNFKENHIELVNHPEISVTLSETLVAPVTESKPIINSNSVAVEKESSGMPNSTSTKKKKKKKKKKVLLNEPVDPVPSAPAQTNDDSQSTPTYVKLPAAGGNCVLLVSHESFSNGNKPTPDNNSGNNLQNEAPVVVLKNPERNNTDNPSVSTTNAENEKSSVSITPIYSNSNKSSENKPEFSVTSSLDKISNMIKNEEANVVDASNLNNVENGEENKPSKAQLKAERRAKQEAQRAAKLAKSNDKEPKAQVKEQSKAANKSTELSNENNKSSAQSHMTFTKDNSVTKDVQKTSVEQVIQRKVQIFSHLMKQRDSLSKKISFSSSKIPSPILELGSHYSKGLLIGSNARCVGFLGAVRQVILDYDLPLNKTLTKDLESKLQICYDYLNICRPLSVSIVNAMKFLKYQIKHLPEEVDTRKAKEELCQSINNFVREEILLAKEAITISTSAKIVCNDTILVFAYSSVVKAVLCKAFDDGKKFHVIVVDSHPKLEGSVMLRRLVKHGLSCSFISINTISYVIKKVNKVVIGAHALLANGYVMSRLGCKILSLVGSTNSVPVLVCCETYKFWERTLTDSVVHNELGNPEDLLTMSVQNRNSLLKWHDLSSLQIYNLLYDVTQSDFISVIITEKGLIPCTSVPVLLRVKHAGFQEQNVWK